MATSIPNKPKRRGTWFVVFVGILEIAAAVAFFELKGVASAACGVALGGAMQPVPAVNANAGSAGPAVGAEAGGLPESGASPSAMPQGEASPLPASSPAVAASAQAGAAGTAGDAHVEGDTNQIVDPNCVAKTAAGLLSEDTPAPGPTCGPMKQPAALKAAERQLQK